jgi:hypothetical protein
MMASQHSMRAILLDAEVTYRELGNPELADVIDWLGYAVADLYDDTHSYISITRLKAARDEWARRERLHAAGHGVPSPSDARYQQIKDLAQQVKAAYPILGIFSDAGYHLERQGKDEYAGACLVCAGRDRFIVFTDPPAGRYWCRQCGLRGDVIRAARSLLPDRYPDFTTTVLRLAKEIDLDVPEDQPTPKQAPGLRTGRQVITLAPGGRRRAVTLTKAVPSGV